MRRLGLLRRSRSSNVIEFGTNQKLICDFLLVINTNLLLPCTVCEIERSIYPKSLYSDSATHLVFNSPDRGFLGTISQILSGCQERAMVPNGVKKLRKISIACVGCTNVTDRRQTDGQAIAVHVR